jgi:GNAT superfamily N-acetyltransferase
VSGDPLAAYPKTVVLRDGLHVVLRPMTPADRPGVATLLAGDGGPSVERADAVLVATEGERTAGVALLARHGDAAHVAVELDPGYRGRRLGTWMLLDAVHLAGELGVARVEARVRPGDAPLEAALRRLDFVPAPPRDADGARVFVKTIHAGWTDF